MRAAPHLAVCACGLLFAAVASAERSKVSLVILYGDWFGTMAGRPDVCQNGGMLLTDGYWVTLTPGRQYVSMTVQPLTRGRVSTETLTQYRIATPPGDAPESLELFLHNETADAVQADVAVDVLNSSTLDWVPAGADRRYAAVSLHLYKCERAEFPR